MKTGDTGGVLEYLQKKKLTDPNFFYAIQVDKEDLITNIFWVDARMMVDYDYLGDVVCFDTTFRKNKEGRPFAMFVGVNHHKQSVIFGAALLYDETAETFEWLFDIFAKTMSGKKPKSIFTDQDAAMAKALASEWPETTHRLCIWHIFQNAAKHLNHVFEKFDNFAKEFSNCVYDYEEEKEFIDAWKNMLEKYKLQDNEWLSRLFNIKEKWALVYGRNTFSAEITTTQRSESLNSLVKKYVNYKYDMLRFFRRFEGLVDDRRYEELKADFKASQSFPALSFPVKILKHAAIVYTHEVLKLFQKQLCKAHNCTVNYLGDTSTTVRKYGVIPHAQEYHQTVIFDMENNNISCSCRKFEFAGILCSHALKVLSLHNIKSIPTQYILKRWTKDVKSGSVKISPIATTANDPKGDIIKRYRELCRLHVQLATRASESSEAYEIALSGFNNTLAKVDDILRGITTKENSQAMLPTTNNLEEPSVVVPIHGDNGNVRGIKIKEKEVGVSSKRPQSGLETETNKKKKGALETATTKQKRARRTLLDPKNSDSQHVMASQSHFPHPPPHPLVQDTAWYGTRYMPMASQFFVQQSNAGAYYQPYSDGVFNTFQEQQGLQGQGLQTRQIYNYRR
ncbi:protein FAR1-RELATED SEQUENCE 9-like [Papaver somniferum]|uniref:protein FAR1-RELATED SEQUENCE 9-like n=1 Tax=Papaver somniferum TaxID=3469 RepID=UPI000E6F801B|nr:protein FAR1-RELATED SEQUENCE 9-like [Papaver somniferum]